MAFRWLMHIQYLCSGPDNRAAVWHINTDLLSPTSLPVNFRCRATGLRSAELACSLHQRRHTKTRGWHMMAGNTRGVDDSVLMHKAALCLSVGARKAALGCKVSVRSALKALIGSRKKNG